MGNGLYKRTMRVKGTVQTTIAVELLSWYDNREHNFPWRGTNDPYKIWLSEVMLQQTRVQTVKPYFMRWMQVFPNIKSVASADAKEKITACFIFGLLINFKQQYKLIINDDIKTMSLIL